MANAFTLFGEISLDTSGLNRGLNDAEQRLGRTRDAMGRFTSGATTASAANNQLANSTGRSNQAFGSFSATLESTSGKLNKIGGALAGAGATLSASITAPLTGLAYAAVNSAKDLQSLEMGLTAVTGSADAAKTQMVQLKEIAKLPGLGFKEAMQGAINLQATGLSAELSQRALKGFGNALATVGKGKADLDGVVTALSQMQSKGKISAEEINQIAERVPQIRKVMQEAFGTADTKALEKMGISTDQFIAKVTTQLEKLPPVATSAQGEFENFGDAMEMALKPLGDAILPILVGAMQQIAPVVQQVAEYFSNLSPTMQTVVIAVAAVAAAIGPLLLTIGGLLIGLASLVEAWAVLAPIGTALGAVFGSVGASILPIIGIIAAVAAAAYLLYKAWDTNFAGIRDRVQNAMTAVKDAVQNAIQTVMDWWAKNGTAIKQAGQTLYDFGAKVLQYLEPVASFFLDILGANMKMLWDIVKAVFKGIWDVISNVFMTIVNLINGDWAAAWDSFKGIFSGLAEMVGSVLKAVWNYVSTVFDKVLGLLTDAATWVVDKAKAIGSAILDGITSTLKSGATLIWDAIKSLGMSAISAFKSVLGIASPSKVFQALGKDTVQGFIDGLAMMKGTANAALASLIDIGMVGPALKKNVAEAFAGFLQPLISEMATLKDATAMQSFDQFLNKFRDKAGALPPAIQKAADAIRPFIKAVDDTRQANKDAEAAAEASKTAFSNLESKLLDLIPTIQTVPTNYEELKKALNDTKFLEELAKKYQIPIDKLKEMIELRMKFASLEDLGIKPTTPEDLAKLAPTASTPTGTRTVGDITGIELPPPPTEWQKFLDNLTAGLAKMKAELPSFAQALSGSLVNFVEGVGDVFSNAVRNWDGTWKGLWKSIKEGMKNLVMDIIAQLLKLMVMKAIFKMLGGLGIDLKLPAAKTGGLVQAASGGIIRGQGTGTSDSIFAMLSNGEYVMPAATVRKFGVSFFDAIRASQGLPARMYAAGGVVGTPGMSGISNSNNTATSNTVFNINVSGNATPQQTATQIQTEVLRGLRRIDMRNR